MSYVQKIYKIIAIKGLWGKDINYITHVLKKEENVNKEMIASAVKELINTGKIGLAKNKTIFNKASLVEGKFKRINAKIGVVEVDGKEIVVNNDISARDGDKVLVDFITIKGEKKGFLTKILDRKSNLIYGRVLKANNKFTFIPDENINSDFYLLEDEKLNDSVGKKVALKIVENSGSFIVGSIDKVFGLAGDPIVENQAIASEYGFVKEFPLNVEEETNNISKEITDDEISKRLDLRELPFVTIDGADCKDKDDAVYVERTDKGFKVYVAIADVAHFIKKDSLIDVEANKRGTSCYLGDGVYPMYPEKLSNDICSLNEGEDKLTLTTIIDIDEKGKILNYDIKKTIINVDKCLTYDNLEAVDNNDEIALVDFANQKELIDTLYDVNDVLMRFRDKRGAIEFRGSEPSFVFDDLKTGVVDVVDNNETFSRKIIESLMILANEVVGDYFNKNKVPILYRVHDKPSYERLNRAKEIFNFLGANFEGEPIQANIKNFLKSIEGMKSEEFLNNTMLRCMDKAKYSPENIGHFALASKNYIHFTAPIRRYPDTLTHRVLHELIELNESSYSFNDMVRMGIYLSEQEYNASMAERKSDELLMTMWAENHINEVINCNIVSLGKHSMKVKYGLIELELLYEDLPNGNYDYKLNETKTQIKNVKTKKQYKIGGKIDVKILAADRKSRTIYSTTDLTKKLEFSNNEEKEKLCQNDSLVK